MRALRHGGYNRGMTHEGATHMLHDVALLFAFAEREADARADGPRANRRSDAARGGEGRVATAAARRRVQLRAGT